MTTQLDPRHFAPVPTHRTRATYALERVPWSLITFALGIAAGVIAEHAVMVARLGAGM